MQLITFQWVPSHGTNHSSIPIHLNKQSNPEIHSWRNSFNHSFGICIIMKSDIHRSVLNRSTKPSREIRTVGARQFVAKISSRNDFSHCCGWWGLSQNIARLTHSSRIRLSSGVYAWIWNGQARKTYETDILNKTHRQKPAAPSYLSFVYEFNTTCDYTIHLSHI